MTPKLFSTLLLSLSFAACEIDSDLVQLSGQPQSNTLLARTDSCLEITTTHWLWGSGTEQPLLEMAQQEAPEGSPLSKRLVIQATGDAMSKELSRGLSTLNLVYHSGDHTVTGSLVTQFHFGEVLELTFDDQALVKYSSNSMDLQLEVLTATLRTNTVSYTLSSGGIKLSLPRQHGGKLNAEMNTGTILCVQ